MKPSERNEFVVTIAMLRGAEFRASKYTSGWWFAVGDGHASRMMTSKPAAAEDWLRHFGIWIDEYGAVSDLSTKVEE